MLWVLICTVRLTVCSYHVTYAFQSESTLYTLNPHSKCLSVRLWTKATIECGFTLKRVRDMIRTHSQIQRTDKYSQHSSFIWPVRLNGWVFVHELSGCGFESSYSHLNFRFRACFEQEVPWHSGNYRVCIHSETRTWRDKNIQLKSRLYQFLFRKVFQVHLETFSLQTSTSCLFLSLKIRWNLSGFTFIQLF